MTAIDQNSVRSRRPQGLIGKLAERYEGSVQEITLQNNSGVVAQVDDIKVDTATNDHLYTFLINGELVQYQADATATKAEICDGLAAAFITTPLARGYATCVSDGVDNITITAIYPGIGWTITNVDSKCTLTNTTANATASSVGFGLAIMSLGYQAGEDDELGAKAASALFTPQVMTITPTYVASAEVAITVINKHTGLVIASFAAVSDTDLADLCAELAAGLNTQLPNNSVIADGSSGTEVTLTAEVAGLEFDAYVLVGDQGASVPTFTVAYTTGPSPSTSLLKAFAGISKWSSNDEDLTIATDDPAYAANVPMKVVKKGEVWVHSEQTITHKQTVYVELGTTNTGMFYNTNSSTRLSLPASMAVWERDGRAADGDNLAVIRLNVA